MSPRFWLIALLLVLLTACNPQSTATPDAPTVAATSAPIVEETPDPTATSDGTTIAPTADTPVTPTALPNEPALPEAETTQTVTGDVPELPLPPTSLMEVPPWLNTIAGNGNDIDSVRTALLESQWLESEEDLRLMPMRGDGGEVWVVRATRPLAEDEFGNAFGKPGALFIVDPAANALVYEAFGQAAIDIDEAFFPAPTVLTDTDFTGDGVLDLLFKLSNCGANTCYDEYHIVSYHGGSTPQDVIRAAGFTYEGEEVADLPFVTMAYSEAYLGDDSGDSITDLQLVGGTQGSAGAGPQRARDETYGWDGSAVVLLQLAYETSNLRYFTLLDANNAFDAQEYETARTLYEQAISDTALQPSLWLEGSEESETTSIQRYAGYRLVLLDVLEGDAAAAQQRAEALVAAAPNDIIAVGALTTAQSFAATGSVEDACAAYTATVQGLEPDPLAPLDDMGYANPILGAATLCPFASDTMRQ